MYRYPENVTISEVYMFNPFKSSQDEFEHVGTIERYEGKFYFRPASYGGWDNEKLDRGFKSLKKLKKALQNHWRPY